MVSDPSDHCLLQTLLKQCGSEDQTNGSILVLTWASGVSGGTATWTVAVIDLKVNCRAIKMSKGAQKWECCWQGRAAMETPLLTSGAQGNTGEGKCQLK